MISRYRLRSPLPLALLVVRRPSARAVCICRYSMSDIEYGRRWHTRHGVAVVRATMSAAPAVTPQLGYYKFSGSNRRGVGSCYVALRTWIIVWNKYRHEKGEVNSSVAY